MVLNAEVSRKDGAPTLVLVHGVAGSLHIWDPVFADLSQRYTVVRMDLLGYGHSPKPSGKYTPARHVDAIRSTLQAQGLKPPYHFAGLSMGATLVLAYADAYPREVASLTMIGWPYYADVNQAKQGLQHNLWAGLTINHTYIARVFIPAVWHLGRLGLLPPRLFAGIYTGLQARETLLVPYRVFRENIWGCMVHVDAARLLAASADLPRQFIHGEDDEWSPAERVEVAVKKYQGSRFTLVIGAGHNTVVLEPQTIVKLLNEFIPNIPIIGGT